MEQIKNIILVVSGKGGVGKSTVASNLAYALAKKKCATALFDADLYGPSVPMVLGLDGQCPDVQKKDDKETFEPLTSGGIKVMSIGFLLKKEDPVIWRGPMVSKALTQLLEDTNWGELDYLIIDMPPGTGDIAITVAQKLPQSKAVVVITPQQVAVADGRKAAHMLSNRNINIPILGIIENMSFFIPERHPDEKYLLFGKGGGEQLSKELNVPLLAQIPLVADVCNLCDSGKTIFESSNAIIKKVFDDMVNTIMKENSACTQMN